MGNLRVIATALTALTLLTATGAAIQVPFLMEPLNATIFILCSVETIVFGVFAVQAWRTS